MTWLTTIWAKAQGWVLAGLAVAGALAGAWLAGKREGRADAKAGALQDTIDKVRERDEAISGNAALDDSAIRDRARRRMREHNDR